MTQMTQIDRASLSAKQRKGSACVFSSPTFDMTLLAKDTGNVKDNMPGSRLQGDHKDRPYDGRA
jgi:hypothetical protein